MRTLAVLGFIALVAAVGILLARQPTVADGRVIAGELLTLYDGKGVAAVTCDPQIPIGQRGATFACTVTTNGGARFRVAGTLDREGKLAATPADEAGPSQDAPGDGADPETAAPGPARGSQAAPPARQNAPSGDPWAN